MVNELSASHLSDHCLQSRPFPVKTFDQAMRRVEVLSLRDTQAISPLGYSRCLHHNRRAERAIVFLHSYTSSPHQFDRLGQQFFDLGYNVLLPRLPRHGLKDRLTEDQARLSAGELVSFADEVVDIACGLGEKVILAGISMSGTLAGWVAQHRRDVDLAVLIAPAFAYRAIPPVLARAAAEILRELPNAFRWWNPREKDETPGLEHAYPRYSTHALSEILRLSFAVERAARQAQAAARRLLVMTNPADRLVNNAQTAHLVGLWRRSGSAVETYEFPAGLKLTHDLIDPGQRRQQVDQVYPLLVEQIGAHA